MGGEGEELLPEEKNGKSRRACLHKQLHKTKFCSYYLKGACHYGDDCAFAHTCAELQATPDLRKTRTCKAFAEGKCTDENCSFAHGEHQLISTGLFHKMSLCKWHEKGRCRNGDQCRFAHGVGELRDSKTALASPAAATQAKSDAGTSWVASEPQPMKGDVRTSWVASEPQPMKVPPPAVGLPLGSAAAALAMTSVGLPAMPKVPTWPDSSLSAISALDAWQPQRTVHSPGLRMQNSMNTLMEIEQLRMSIAGLSSLCTQMQQQLMPLAPLARGASPPGFQGNTLGHVELGADKISAAQLTKMSGRGPSTKPSSGMTTAEARMFCSGFGKEALGA